MTIRGELDIAVVRPTIAMINNHFDDWSPGWLAGYMAANINSLREGIGHYFRTEFEGLPS
jgi:hypothetical protein